MHLLMGYKDRKNKERELFSGQEKKLKIFGKSWKIVSEEQNKTFSLTIYVDKIGIVRKHIIDLKKKCESY